MIDYQHICKLLAAKHCYEKGQTVKEIAKSAKVSESTVRKWLKEGGVILRRN